MDIFSLLDEIQAIARNGLHYTSEIYDRERYERLMELATQTYDELLDVPAEKVRARFLNELGYITPKV
ncbi:MAG: NUDIX hydrolase N-terminal domain-containing protein, partial [Anaerolineae bacterium]|nr:NUDIX hydrolase N-terminal domain-containing protein [Anaerolineae bacterium]